MENAVLIAQFIAFIIEMYFMTKSIMANKDYERDYYDLKGTLFGIVTILLWFAYYCMK